MDNTNNNLKDIFTDTIDISTEWLDIQEYELKILILTSILATQNFAYRGTLTTMCEWLGIKPTTNNNKNIKKALEHLQEQEYIYYKVDGRTYTISISNKGMKDKQIVKVRKLWIEAFKRYNRDENNNKINKSISIDWIQIVRVFVFLYQKENNGSNIITSQQIAEALNISKTTVSNALKAIEQCDLQGLRFTREIIKDKWKDVNGNTHYQNVGTEITFMIKFAEID